MSLIVSLGTNLGNKEDNLNKALNKLSLQYELVFSSPTFVSAAVDYLNQPDFYNRVLEFKTPKKKPLQVLKTFLEIEKVLGRTRDIDKGPRIIDIDMLFWENVIMNTADLTLPHPRIFERSFICLPLKTLPYYDQLLKHFKFPKNFDNFAEQVRPD